VSKRRWVFNDPPPRVGERPARWAACRADGTPEGEPYRTRRDAERAAKVIPAGLLFDRQTGQYLDPVNGRKVHNPQAGRRRR